MKNKKTINTTNIATGNELSKLIKIIILITVIFLVFYLITILVTKKDDKKTAENTEATIQYSKILAGSILNQKEDEYYVLVEFEDDQYNSLYEYYLSLYSSKEKSLKNYKVDMSESFNKKYISEKSNLEAEKIENIKFSKTTLLKIKKSEIVESYEAKDNIISALEKIIK